MSDMLCTGRPRAIHARRVLRMGFALHALAFLLLCSFDCRPHNIGDERIGSPRKQMK